MGHHSKTFEANKKDDEKVKYEIGFQEREFEGVTAIFVVAKTWGVARNFVTHTNLDRKLRIPVKFLTTAKQLYKTHNKLNTLIITLQRYEETLDNIRLVNYAKSKNLRILNYKTIDSISEK